MGFAVVVVTGLDDLTVVVVTCDLGGVWTVVPTATAEPVFVTTEEFSVEEVVVGEDDSEEDFESCPRRTPPAAEMTPMITRVTIQGIREKSLMRLKVLNRGI